MFGDSKDDLVIKRPKVFAEEAKKRGPMYYDYEMFQNLLWEEGSNYICEKKIGRGKYS